MRDVGSEHERVFRLRKRGFQLRERWNFRAVLRSLYFVPRQRYGLRAYVGNHVLPERFRFVAK